MAGKPRPLSVDNKDGCWEISSHKSGKSGYVYLWRNGVGNIAAHRYVYEMWIGEIPDGMVVMHKCDNRICINPDHLTLGTQEDNMHDCTDKNRRPLGDRNGQSKLTWDDVWVIRQRHKDGETGNSIARSIGMSKAQVNKIINNKSWRSNAYAKTSYCRSI